MCWLLVDRSLYVRLCGVKGLINGCYTVIVPKYFVMYFNVLLYFWSILFIRRFETIVLFYTFMNKSL